MPDQQRFSHITVSTDDDDEIVIHAGAPASGIASQMADTGAAAPEPSAVDAADEVADAVAPRPESHVAPTTDDASEASVDASETASRDGGAVAVESTRATDRAKRKDEYRETTLEDLEETKAPLTQRIVIVIAVLLIVAFVVYQIAFA